MEREHHSLESLLNALAFVHTEGDLERFRAHERKGNMMVVLLAILFFLLGMMKMLFNVSHHFQVRDWWSLVGDVLSSLSTLSIPFLFPAVFKSRRGSSALPEKVLELRWRLNDEMLVPPVAEQPHPFETGGFPFASTRIGPIRRIKNLSVLLIGVSFFLLVIDVFLGAIIAVTFSGMLDLATPDRWAALALGFLFFLCVIFTALVMVLVIRLFRAKAVVVDEWGLRWTWPHLIKGRSITLAWPEMAGLYEITGKMHKSNPVKTYLLDSLTSTFVWHLRENSTPKEQQASASLTRLIATRTDLTLRDLTSAVDPLLNPLPGQKEMEEVLAGNQ